MKGEKPKGSERLQKFQPFQGEGGSLARPKILLENLKES